MFVHFVMFDSINNHSRLQPYKTPSDPFLFYYDKKASYSYLWTMNRVAIVGVG